MFVFKPSAALAGGGFTASCNSISLFDNANQLQANCGNNTGQIVRATVYLNGSITNNDGHLAWQRNGGFAGSVRDCRLAVTGVTVLTCSARKRDGAYADSAITLDDEIANYNGVLTVLDGF